MKEMHQTVHEMEQASFNTLGTLYKLGYRDLHQLREHFEGLIQQLIEDEGQAPLERGLAGSLGGQS